MDRNEAEEIVKNTIEYANEEIKKSKKKYMRIFFACLFALLICFTIMFVIVKSRVEVRDLHTIVFVTSVDKIELCEGDITKEITNTVEIQSVFDILNNLGEGKESINDFPVNATDIITINLIQNNSTETVFTYIRNNKYYFEKPYAGVFITTEEIYNKIKDIFNKAE